MYLDLFLTFYIYRNRFVVSVYEKKGLNENQKGILKQFILDILNHSDRVTEVKTSSKSLN